MNYSKRLVLRLDKISKKTKEAPLCLRITINRENTYKKIVSIRPDYWDDENKKVKKQCPIATELNLFITSKVAEIEKSIIQLDAIKEVKNVSAVRNKLQNKSSFDFFEYADKYTLNVMEFGTYSTGKRYKTAVNKLRHFHRKKTLPINCISIDFLKGYDNYLRTTLGNSINTVTSNLKVIRKLLGDIYRDNDLDEISNPFRKYKFKYEQTTRKFLSEENMEKIKNIGIKNHSPLFDAKQLFLFEYHSGIRISDILTLKWKNCIDKEIKYTMRKTKKRHTVPINENIKKILEKKRSIILKQGHKINPEKYIFNILTVDVENSSQHDALNDINRATARINKQLKKVARLAGVRENISTHTARHTFATTLIGRGADIYTVKELLGHSNIKTTQIYAKVIEDRKRTAVELLND